MKDQNISSCKMAARLMSLSFERKLSSREQVLLKTHLAVCRTCRYCLRQLNGLRRLLPAYLKAVATFRPGRESSLCAAARQRLKAALKASSS